ncbi:MAG: zinc-finger domain-containing protein [Magnetospirillum sp.]|nr:zinc-finger domain-containing protein [Magnetospirillum sp.]
MSALPSLANSQVTDSVVASCDGNGGNDGASGHPRVYLNLGDKGEAVCPYCSRRFVLAEGARAGHGH